MNNLISYFCPHTRNVMQPIWLSMLISVLWGMPNSSPSQWKWINDSHLPPVPSVSDWLHPSASAGSHTKHQTSTGGKKELNQHQIDVFDFHHNLFCYHSSEAPDWMCPRWCNQDCRAKLFIFFLSYELFIFLNALSKLHGISIYLPSHQRNCCHSAR